MKQRLQKVLASAGIASRRGAEELIASGDVTVNGRPAHIGQSVDPAVDSIVVAGRPIAAQSGLYLALNKPRGYVTSLRSTHGEATVLDLISLESRVFPVGRLDKDTSGLLLLTNDGDWANLAAHPRYGLEKEYRALVEGHPGRDTIERLQGGMTLPDGTVTAAAEVRILRRERSRALLSIVLLEGKKRQIRRMLRVVGHPVVRLERVRVGQINLGDLPVGRWRNLTAAEVEAIRERGSG